MEATVCVSTAARAAGSEEWVLVNAEETMSMWSRVGPKCYQECTCASNVEAAE